MWLLRLGHKKHCGFLLAVFFGSLAMEEASCHIQEHLSSPVETAAWWEVEASYHQPWSESSWKQVSSWFQSSLQMAAAATLSDPMLRYPKEASSSSHYFLGHRDSEDPAPSIQPTCSDAWEDQQVLWWNIAWPMRPFYWFLQRLRSLRIFYCFWFSPWCSQLLRHQLLLGPEGK